MNGITEFVSDSLAQQHDKTGAVTAVLLSTNTPPHAVTLHRKAYAEAMKTTASENTPLKHETHAQAPTSAHLRENTNVDIGKPKLGPLQKKHKQLQPEEFSKSPSVGKTETFSKSASPFQSQIDNDLAQIDFGKAETFSKPASPFQSQIDNDLAQIDFSKTLAAPKTYKSQSLHSPDLSLLQTHRKTLDILNPEDHVLPFSDRESPVSLPSPLPDREKPVSLPSPLSDRESPVSLPSPLSLSDRKSPVSLASPVLDRKISFEPKATTLKHTPSALVLPMSDSSVDTFNPNFNDLDKSPYFTLPSVKHKPNEPTPSAIPDAIMTPSHQQNNPDETKESLYFTVPTVKNVSKESGSEDVLSLTQENKPKHGDNSVVPGELNISKEENEPIQGEQEDNVMSNAMDNSEKENPLQHEEDNMVSDAMDNSEKENPPQHEEDNVVSGAMDNSEKETPPQHEEDNLVSEKETPLQYEEDNLVSGLMENSEEENEPIQEEQEDNVVPAPSSPLLEPELAYEAPNLEHLSEIRAVPQLDEAVAAPTAQPVTGFENVSSASVTGPTTPEVPESPAVSPQPPRSYEFQKTKAIVLALPDSFDATMFPDGYIDIAQYLSYYALPPELHLNFLATASVMSRYFCSVHVESQDKATQYGRVSDFVIRSPCHTSRTTQTISKITDQAFIDSLSSEEQDVVLQKLAPLLTEAFNEQNYQLIRQHHANINTLNTNLQDMKKQMFTVLNKKEIGNAKTEKITRFQNELQSISFVHTNFADNNYRTISTICLRIVDFINKEFTSKITNRPQLFDVCRQTLHAIVSYFLMLKKYVQIVFAFFQETYEATGTEITEFYTQFCEKYARNYLKLFNTPFQAENISDFAATSFAFKSKPNANNVLVSAECDEVKLFIDSVFQADDNVKEIAVGYLEELVEESGHQQTKVFALVQNFLQLTTGIQ
jgi:hypothetical protein